MAHMKPGTRVRWSDPEPDDPIGTVRRPTPEELCFIATWTSTAQAAIRGHVIVDWDGDEQWEGAWVDPDKLDEIDRSEVGFKDDPQRNTG